MPASTKTFVVERFDAKGQLEKIEVTAERAEAEGNGSTRVTFYTGEDPVGSFINLQGWYEKPAA